MMEIETMFDAARKTFFRAQQAMHDAAVKELASIVRGIYPDATEVKIHGEYNDAGYELVLEITKIVTPAGWEDDVDALDEISELANDALLYMGTVTTGEEYLGDNEVGLGEAPTGCGGSGFLLGQTYGYAEVPEGWTSVQACDECNQYATDEDAAIAAARAVNTNSTQYVAFSYFKAKPDPDDEGEDHPGDWAIHWIDETEKRA